jgi:hypothetical protein
VQRVCIIMGLCNYFDFRHSCHAQTPQVLYKYLMNVLIFLEFVLFIHTFLVFITITLICKCKDPQKLFWQPKNLPMNAIGKNNIAKIGQ